MCFEYDWFWFREAVMKRWACFCIEGKWNKRQSDSCKVKRRDSANMASLSKSEYSPTESSGAKLLMLRFLWALVSSKWLRERLSCPGTQTELCSLLCFFIYFFDQSNLRGCYGIVFSFFPLADVEHFTATWSSFSYLLSPPFTKKKRYKNEKKLWKIRMNLDCVCVCIETFTFQANIEHNISCTLSGQTL